ncbi:MAG: acyl--CoA ligase, partial [Planctomycetes bacterium]|nr:acyl--CoA ligase [Planctomycetota bacterium]
MDRAATIDGLLSAFRARVDADPDGVCVIGPDRSVTPRELDDAARRMARTLVERGASGRIVALRSENGPTFLATLVAGRLVGATLALIDSGTPTEAMVDIARSLGAIGCIASRCGWSDDIDWLSTDLRDIAHTPNVAVIKLTSGSSGTPRGINVDSAALLADSEALGRSFGFGAGDRFVATIPMSHSYGLSVLAVPALALGTILICSRNQNPLSVARRHGARLFPTVPSYLRALTSDDGLQWPTCVETIIAAGEPTCRHAAQEFEERTGRPICVFYGASESGGITFDPVGAAARRGTVGRPIAGVDVRLTDPDPDGVGTIEVRSPAVALGYHPEPDDALLPGHFVTGDLGRWEETENGPELMLCGRKSQWINVRGRKVDPALVERVISEI